MQRQSFLRPPKSQMSSGRPSNYSMFSSLFKSFRIISHVQTQLGVLLEQLHTERSESKVLVKFSDQVLKIALSLDRLAESLSHHYINVPADENVITNVVEYSSTSEEDEVEEEAFHRKVFDSAELRNYTLPKPNRPSGKKKLLGLESVYPSIGQGCARLASTLDRFMTYKAYHMCPDDWDLAQKLMITVCDPLPRRRCFSRTPRYDKPRPLSSSLWTQPRDVDISWSRYKCKNYQCLVSNKTINNKDFYKCSDCFDLTKRGWNVQRNKNVSAEFSIDEILMLKPGEIRIGLDFSPTTGTFAALMREKNVTIASATLNLGAPFNEVIASKGLLPLYISVGSRLPFFDNTLDIVHSTLFMDGWIGIELLQFILLDWDRILRPKGLLYVDRFFCKKENMKMYVDEFDRIGYKKLLWRVVPKKDKLDDELFLLAVLEKPVRG
ncbi:S-adenosyl-L-methionine-dependent methyltransferase superfamily protein [Abeliophyllum distichum]|uniref:S-adenosyl-L-methionine-dependent methyltransferase superfamily protein n=1 Tax=Abeliophyllum distichum TaxID=126358 RepID=A0ABD1SWW7_9LAMI